MQNSNNTCNIQIIFSGDNIFEGMQQKSLYEWCGVKQKLNTKIQNVNFRGPLFVENHLDIRNAY